MEGRCTSILQQAVEAHCNDRSRAEQVEELKRVREDLIEKNCSLKKDKGLQGYIRVEMVLAGLNAFENVESLVS